LLPRVIYTGGGIDDIMTNSDLREKEIANLLRKHGGKTGEELKAEGK
jgi:hypothetical protein